MNDFWNWFWSLFRPNPPSPPQPPPSPPPPEPPPTPPSPKFVTELLTAHNSERQKAGVGILNLDTRLVMAAEKHAQWMADNELLSHTGVRGSSSSTRIRNEGYRAQATGENIARGYTTVASVMQGWMSSSGHRKNILAREYKHCGFAKAGRYWCAVFATPINQQLVLAQVLNYETKPLFGMEE